MFKNKNTIIITNAIYVGKATNFSFHRRILILSVMQYLVAFSINVTSFSDFPASPPHTKRNLIIYALYLK